MTVTFTVLMPACRAASSFAPVRRSWKPNAVRCNMNQTINTMAPATKMSHDNEVFASKRGHLALCGRSPDRGNVLVGSWRGPRTSQLTSWIATKFKRRVEMISFTDRRAHSHAATPA